MERKVTETTFGTVFGATRIVPLTDHVFFQEGPGLRKWQWTDSGMKVINGRNVLLGGMIDLANTARYISLDEFESRYSHFAVEDGDIVVTSSGTIGKVGRINRRHLPLMMNTSVIRFHPLRGAELDAGFLFSFLRSSLFQQQAMSFAIGAAQPNFGPAHLKQMKMPLPPLPTQRKIGGILSAYDDLIENNLRRIKILEEMAQNLYREWFVKFRFPGHEKVKMVDSSLGRIPEGWEATRLDAVTSYINRGVIPKYDDSSPSLVINQRCIRGHKLNLGLARHHRSRVMDEKYVQFGDVLINSTGVGTLGRVTQVYEKMRDTTVDTHVSIVRPACSDDIDFLGVALVELEPHFESLGAGATGQTELRRDRIGETDIVLPPPKLRRIFSGQVVSMRQMGLNQSARNTVLRRTRDLLLPRLISGEVDVSELDIAVPEEVGA